MRLIVWVDIYLLDVLNFLKIETEDLSIEGALGKWLDMELRRLLEPVWNQVNQKTRQLIGDLKLLRELLKWVMGFLSIMDFRSSASPKTLKNDIFKKEISFSFSKVGKYTTFLKSAVLSNFLDRGGPKLH